jgi:hypothetical protein
VAEIAGITPSAAQAGDVALVRRGASFPFDLEGVPVADLTDPLVLTGRDVAPDAPAAGKIALYARSRAGTEWLDFRRSNGRTVPLAPHPGYNLVAEWRPSTTTTIINLGIPIGNVGTVSHPVLAATSRATSMRRWRMTSAATASAIASNRASAAMVWRGNAEGLGGWILTTRIVLAILAETGTGFFGLNSATGAPAVGQLLAPLTNTVGIGFQRGTHDNWQVVHNDAAGSATLVDMGAGFPVAVDRVLTLTIAAPPNGSSVWVRVVDEDSGAVHQSEITTDLPASTAFLAPRMFLSNLATAQAVAYDCAGFYLESDN